MRAWPCGCALCLMKNVECIMKNSVGSLYSDIILKNINCNCVIKKKCIFAATDSTTLQDVSPANQGGTFVYYAL